MAVPAQHRTPRLLLRPWSTDDAERLLPVLEANQEHLSAWIPSHVAAPVSLPELRQRLSSFSAAFAGAREWRYAMIPLETETPIGELSMFPRDAERRTDFRNADRVEIGYWLASGYTGRGLATEAVQAALVLASRIPRFGHAEIRCDARNGPSAAIPHRLGFELDRSGVAGDGPTSGAEEHRQVWRYALGAADRHGGASPR